MKIIFRWWSLWDGRHTLEVSLPKIKDGYVSKPAQKLFDAAVKTIRELPWYCFNLKIE